MARKLRLEYAGANYHVISRGNYRADVFGDEATKSAFLACLGEACLKTGWVVHAWCVMANHYHLCLETPEPNLVQGMRWLQATFSKGWMVGSPAFKKELLWEHRHLAAAWERGDEEATELATAVWEERIRTCLAALGKNDEAVAEESKGAGWKVAIAATLKSSTTATNPWLAQRLNMGSPFRLSRLVSACRAAPQPYASDLKRIAKCKV